MLGLARYAMHSPLRTCILAAVFAVLPFLYVVSAALVALTTLRHGLSAGTRVLLAAMVGGLISWQLTAVPLSLLTMTLATLLAVVLRETRSWNRTLLAGAGLALAFALVAQSLFQPQLDKLLDLMVETVAGRDMSGDERTLVNSLKPYVAFFILASELTEGLLALLLARFWQAGLYNPGGLKQEMHALRLSRFDVLALVLAMLFAVQIQPGAILLFGIPFVFAGMALMHGIVAKLNLGGQWLVALYIAIVLINQIVIPLLILLVMVDSVIDIRRRMSPRSQSDNE